MPQNGFTVGKDATITITGPGGTSIVISADQVTDFDPKPMKKEIWSRPLNSPPKPIFMPDGWTGTITVDRADATLDTFQATLEANFWNGVDTLAGTILQTVTETNGAVTQYQFTGVMFWVSEVGSYKADGLVTQQIEFAASLRTRVT